MFIQTEIFTICPVQADEWESVLTVYRQCEDFLALTPQPHATMQIVDEDRALSERAGGMFCGIYQRDGSMMGIVDVILRGFEGDPSAAFIELIMIAAPFRTKGLGAAVVKAVESEIARDSQVTSILLAVMVNNPQAIRFWEQQGYTRSSGPHAEPDGTTVWRYLKQIR